MKGAVTPYYVSYFLNSESSISLFMTAGIIDHEAHTRDIKKLGGLRRLMPITFAIATIASLSVTSPSRPSMNPDLAFVSSIPEKSEKLAPTVNPMTMN